MKIWRLTFLDSAYLKYESKLELPLLPKNALISVFQASFSAFRPDYGGANTKRMQGLECHVCKGVSDIHQKQNEMWIKGLCFSQ